MRRPVYTLCLSSLRGTVGGLARTVREWRTGTPGVVVADAVTLGDLDRLARLIAREDLFTLTAGSAGLAMAIGGVVTWPRRSGHRRPHLTAPVLLVVGSPNPMSLAQVGRIEEAGEAAVIRAALAKVIADGDRYRRELERVVKKASVELEAGRDTVLTLAQSSGSSSGQRMLPPSASKAISEFLGQATERVSRAVRLGGLLLCGGDIAIAACSALGARAIELQGEVEPGVPWGHLVGGDLKGLPVVTKAGGFGKPETFGRVLRFFRPRTRPMA